MNKFIISVFLILILTLVVGCEKTGQTVNVAQEEQKGKLLTVREQSVEINKPTSPPTTVPSAQDNDQEQQSTSNKELIEQLSKEKGLDVDESDDSAQSSSSSNAKNTILILNFKGNPSTLEAKVGAAVTWKNADVYGHKIGIFKIIEGPVLRKEDTWSYTFTEPGNYTWMSMGHPKTNGNVIITE